MPEDSLHVRQAEASAVTLWSDPEKTYTPAATKAENAFEIRFPANKIAFRNVNSRRVYHLERIKSAPGRKAASTKPKKNEDVSFMPNSPSGDEKK
jgi:hypothetical protein